MTLQAYIDNIEAKTGMTPEDFLRIRGARIAEARRQGRQIVEWLKDDYGLGRGHAMAIYSIVKPHIGR